MKPKIIFIEDDPRMSKYLKECLTEQFQVIICENGELGINIVSEQQPSLCLLDINLGENHKNGYEICRQIRGFSAIPILFLTVKDDEESIIQGLSCGADDYITKPFSIKVLIERIHSHLRRVKMDQNNAVSEDGFIFNEESSALRYNGTPIPLTKIEFEIVQCLIRQRGCLVTRNTLLERIWDQKGNFVEDNTLTVTVSRLRRRLNQYGKCPIQTVHGIGYRWGEAL